MPKPQFTTVGMVALAVIALASVHGAGPSFRPTKTFSGSALTGWRAIGDADWTASNGEITGRPKSPAGGWLVSDDSFSDVGVFATYKCAAGCLAGVLVRAEKTPDGGMKGIFLPLDSMPIRAFAITVDARGKELTREPLAAPAPESGAAAAARGGRAGGGGGQSGPAAPLTTPLPVLPMSRTGIQPGEWNDAEILATLTNIRVTVEGATGGGPSNDQAGRYGAVALYVGGTGTASYKNVGYRDLLVVRREPEKAGPRFKTQQLSDFYYSWGAATSDFNRDGVLDVVSGPHIFYGPDYVNRREIYVQPTVNPSTEYSLQDMMQFAADFTGDGWADALNCAFGGVGCTLYVNPGNQSRRWDRFRVTTGQSSEIAVMVDVNGDGRQDIAYGAGGSMTWATADPAKPVGPWIVHTVSESGTSSAHGIGAGDLNNDGRMDLLNAYGWWEQPAPDNIAADGLWKYHPVAFFGQRRTGGAEIAVYDVNGDKLNDVVTALDAHGYGLAWFEQKKSANGAISFVQHKVMEDFSTKNAGDVTFTQLHGSTSADIDSDGIPDFIVGKRYWSHNDAWGNDPDTYGPPVLYAYRTVRNPEASGGADLVPELVHNRSGAGAQVHAADVNKDGRIDIVTATKLGTYIFWGQPPPGGRTP